MQPEIHLDPRRVESIRHLGSSVFNYWFGYVANLSLVTWLVSHAWRDGRLGMGTPRFALLALAGLLSWTLTEYLLHRYVYHAWHSFLSVGHALHHEDPQALIGIPWYLTTIIEVGAFALLAQPIGCVIGSGDFAKGGGTGTKFGCELVGTAWFCAAATGGASACEGEAPTTELKRTIESSVRFMANLLSRFTTMRLHQRCQSGSSSPDFAPTRT
jgi:hypothetical protein